MRIPFDLIGIVVAIGLAILARDFTTNLLGGATVRITNLTRSP